MAVTNIQGQLFRSKVPFILSALIIFILVHDYVPIVGFRTPAIVFAGIIALTYLVALFVIGTRHFFELMLKILPLFLLNILQLMHHFIAGHGGVFTELYGLAQFLIIPIFSLYVWEKGDIKLGKLVLAIIIICCVITSITTYLGCLAFPNASRDLATTIRSDDSVLYSTYMQLNIGGFGFIYKITLFIPIIIYLAKSRKLNIVFAILIIIAFLLAIRQSEYTTALLLSVIGLLTVFLSVNLERKKMFRYLAIAVIAGGLLFALIPPILRYYASNTESETVSSRLYDLADVVSGEGQSSSTYSDLDERQNNFQKSWDSFVNSNMMGGWSSARLGGHSFFLDTLGAYGLLGLLLLFIMYSHLYKLYLKPYREKSLYGFILLVLFLAIVQAAVNTDNSFSFMSLIFPLLLIVKYGQK